MTCMAILYQTAKFEYSLPKAIWDPVSKLTPTKNILLAIQYAHT